VRAVLPGNVFQPEHHGQRVSMAGPRPWMACLGGNFSAPRSCHVVFDERFEGWGSEDRDLAYRLFLTGYSPTLLSLPNAVHLKVQEEDWTHMTHEQIVQFLRNKELLIAKYPTNVMADTISLVSCCHLDREQNRWSIGPKRAVPATEVLSQFTRWRREAGERSNQASGEGD
jgi:hypothetical protein